MSDNNEPEITPVESVVPEAPSKRRPSKKLIIILIIAFVVLIAAGVGAYILLRPAQNQGTATTPQTTKPTDDTPEAPKLTAKELVALTRSNLGGELKESTQYDANSDPYPTFSAPAYQPSGYDFSVGASVDYGYASYGIKDTIATDLTAIQKILVDKGLTATVLDPGSAEGSYAASYESDDIICVVSDQKPYQPVAGSKEYSVTIGCADKTAYDANAKQMKPFFEIYAAQSSYDTTHTLMGNLTITDSKTTGYKTASTSISGSVYGSVGGFAGLFYQTPDKVWHYFTGTQSQLACTQFNTDDLKKAYLGETCYIEGDDTATVKL